MSQQPPRTGRPVPPSHAPNAALLIDFDNVTLGVRSDLTKELRTLLNTDIIKGKVAVQRAYADWRRYPQYIVPLSESSIDLIFAPAFGTNKKNATDIRLAVDAIELVFTRPEIGTFILLSGDSDFSTLVIKLKEYGKYVIGVGIRESASDLLIQNCDEYYSYSDLAGLTREADVPSIQRDPWELVQEAVASMSRNGDVMRSDRLKQVMQELDPNFDERNAGFNRFSKFVMEAGQRGLVLVSKLDNGQYEVAPAGAARRGGGASTAAKPAAGRPEREDAAPARRGRRRGRGRDRKRDEEREAEPKSRRPARGEAEAASLTLANAFHLMTRALGELTNPVEDEALRLRMIALHGREDPLLEPGRYLRLLRQANDAEVADVRKLGEDEYEISLHPTQRGAVVSVPRRPPAEDEAEGESPDQPEDEEDAQPSAGLRYRRGSRQPTRKAEVPMVGVVRIDDGGDAEKASEPAAKPTRTRRTKAAAKKAAAAATEDGAEEPAKPRRKRARRKKAAPKKSAEPEGAEAAASKAAQA